eukprot:gene7676-8483_t
MIENFGDEEISVIRTIFDSFDIEREGKIHINQVSSMLFKLGRKEGCTARPEDIAHITDEAAKVADEHGGLVTFQEIVDVMRRHEKSRQVFIEGADPKVLEFLRILEEYRIQCEESGNYLEASRAHKQLQVLRKQEERRQQKVIQARHISERQDVQLAHNMQFQEFNRAWDKYLEEYDQMAQVYIQQMTERHAIVLLEFQKRLRAELASKPPKWSKELLDQRRKQHINARNKNYVMAQKLKQLSDRNEEKEKREMEQMQAVAFARREAKFRQQQQVELQALLKRIECRRKEHIKQRELDTKRLLQRNRNVQAVLENKQAAEQQKLFAAIKKNLYSSAVLGHARGAKTIGSASAPDLLGHSKKSPVNTKDFSHEMNQVPSPSMDLQSHRDADAAIFIGHLNNIAQDDQQIRETGKFHGMVYGQEGTSEEDNSSAQY